MKILKMILHNIDVGNDKEIRIKVVHFRYDAGDQFLIYPQMERGMIYHT
jgi:hypothetical protein